MIIFIHIFILFIFRVSWWPFNDIIMLQSLELKNAVTYYDTLWIHSPRVLIILQQVTSFLVASYLQLSVT